MEITLKRGHPHQINGLIVTLVDRDTAILRVGEEAPATAENVVVEGADVMEETEAA